MITRNILRDCDPEYRVIIVGDAAMEMSDLTFHPLESTRNNMGYCSLQWLKHLLDRYPYIVWLTPYVLHADRLFGPWGQTYKVIDELFHIRPLTVAGLEESMKCLEEALACLTDFLQRELLELSQNKKRTDRPANRRLISCQAPVFFSPVFRL